MKNLKDYGIDTAVDLSTIESLLRSMNTRLGVMERIMVRTDNELGEDYGPDDDEVQDRASEILLATALKQR